MKIYIARYFVLSLVICLAIIRCANGQERGSQLKVGGMVYLLNWKYNGFSLHGEYEMSIGRKAVLSSGPRVDFINAETSYTAVFIGYEVKLYPLAKIFSEPHQGPFIGVDPAYLVRSYAISYARYGPGIGMILGYQQILKNRFSLSAEASTIPVKDINEKTIQRNSEHLYWYAFACIKFGIRL